MLHNYKHGRSGTPTYWAWQNMKARCNNPNYQDYHRYGGRGIHYDPKWEDFQTFFEDMGSKPFPNAQVDRIDNDGNYTPENCRWVTPAEQSRNRSDNKLTPRKVEIIQGLILSGIFQYKEIANTFDVDPSTISNVATGKTWS